MPDGHADDAILLAALDEREVLPLIRRIDAELESLIAGLAAPARDLAAEHRRARALLHEAARAARLATAAHLRAAAERQHRLLTVIERAYAERRRVEERERESEEEREERLTLTVRDLQRQPWRVWRVRQEVQLPRWWLPLLPRRPEHHRAPRPRAQRPCAHRRRSGTRTAGSDPGDDDPEPACSGRRHFDVLGWRQRRRPS
jgi:hypothetical protein